MTEAPCMTPDTPEARLRALVEKWRDYIRQLGNESESQPDRLRAVYCDGKAAGFLYCANEVEAVLSSLASAPAEPCVWIEDSDGVWNTDCGVTWVFSDGSPAENRTNFCHHCGHPVKPQTHIETIDAEDDASAQSPEPEQEKK